MYWGSPYATKWILSLFGGLSSLAEALYSSLFRNTAETFMSTKNTHQDSHLQEFMMNTIELKNDSVNNIETIIRKKYVTQNNQLTTFLMKILYLQNESEPHKFENVTQNHVHSDNQLKECLSIIIA